MTSALLVETTRGFSIHINRIAYPPTYRTHELAAMLEMLEVEEIHWRFMGDLTDNERQHEAVAVIQMLHADRDRMRKLKVPLGSPAANERRFG